MSVSILVVDDEPDVAELFRQHFRREARRGTYVLHFAASGEEALDTLANGVRPELIVILSDINMPGMSRSDAAHIAFDGSERLGLRNIISFVAQSPTPSDHCVRFAVAVADDYATLASRRLATSLPVPVFHRQDRVSFA